MQLYRSSFALSQPWLRSFTLATHLGTFLRLISFADVMKFK